MSNPEPPQPAALIAGLLLAAEIEPARALNALSENLGPVEFASEPFGFDYTRYYEKEMGPGIRRAFCVFRELVDPGDLVKIKIETNRLERAFLENDNRRVNFDPGLLSAEKLVLATGKSAPHRIYLSRGIWAEVTLVFESGNFVPLKWTYPDYQDERTFAFLDKARNHCLAQLRARNRETAAARV